MELSNFVKNYQPKNGYCFSAADKNRVDIFTYKTANAGRVHIVEKKERHFSIMFRVSKESLKLIRDKEIEKLIFIGVSIVKIDNLNFDVVSDEHQSNSLYNNNIPRSYFLKILKNVNVLEIGNITLLKKYNYTEDEISIIKDVEGNNNTIIVVDELPL